MENAFISDISEIFQRDLETLINEVNQISEENLWKSHPGIINSVGTISYHLCGNLSYFIGEVLGNDGYIYYCAYGNNGSLIKLDYIEIIHLIWIPLFK